MTVELIRGGAAQLVAVIRRFSSSQVELWRRVPWLALEADGRTGHGDNNGRAFHLGVWAVRAPQQRGDYEAYVDLLTGDLVNPYFFQEWKESRPATDDAVLRLASNPEVLDAAALVARLEAESKAPHAQYYHAAEKEEWRARLRQELHLKPTYDKHCKRNRTAETAIDD